MSKYVSTALRSRLTFANVVALLALFMALGGTSYAAITLTNNSVKSKHIANGQVKTNDIKNNDVRSADVRNNSLTGDDINESTLGQVPSANSANSANTANSAANATNAVNATNAANATNATNATNAGNANTLGGLTAAQLQQPIAYGDVESNALVAGSAKNVNSVRKDANGIYCIDVTITPVVAIATADPGDFRYANASAVPSGCEAGEDISVHTRLTDGNTATDSDFNFVAFGG